MHLLRNPKAPALPVATKEYVPEFFTRLLGALRIYFNTIDSGLAALFGRRGGRYLEFPYGAFSSTQTQSVATINTPTRVTLNTTDFASGTSFVAGDGIHVEQDGIYNLQFSVQVTNSDTQIHDMALWLRKGTGTGTPVDIPYTSSVVSVPGTHGGQPGYHVLAANFYVELGGTDFVELWWSTNSTQVELNTLPPITTPFVNPGSPSVVVTLSFVSSPAE